MRKRVPRTMPLPPKQRTKNPCRRTPCRSTLFSTSNRKRAAPHVSLSFFSRAFRGAAPRTVLHRRGAFRESMSERGHRRCPSEFRFAAPARSRAVSRSASSPAAFFVPFLAGQKGDIPTGSLHGKKHPYGTSVEPTPKRPESIRPERPNEPGAPRQPVRSSATSTTHSLHGQDRRRSGCSGPR